MTSSNCTITVLPDILTFVHIPRSRLQQFSHYLVKQILTPAPSFLNITCNKTDLLLFCHYSAVRDFEPFARTGRDTRPERRRKPHRVGFHHFQSGPRRLSTDADAIEVSYDTWNVLQLDSHNDRLDNAGARIRELSAVLAEAGISIMYQSSYTSDFIFVKSSRLPQVLSRLAHAGFVGYSVDSLPPSLHSEAPLIPSNENEPDTSSPGLVFEHNPNLMRSFSSETGISIPSSSFHSSHHSHSASGQVEVLDQDLICVGLPEMFTEMWSLKIIKLIAYPELILIPTSANPTSIYGSDSRLPQLSGDCFRANGLSELDITSPMVSSSSSTHVGTSPCSEEEYSTNASTPSHSELDDPSSQHSRSLPEISSFGKKKIQRIKRNSLEPKATTSTNDTCVLFFSFTRTAEGSSLTASRKHIGALFPSSERHMIICGDELDVENGGNIDPFFSSDLSEDLAIMKCLQLDIRRFGGDRHGIISSYSKILDSNGINHMYSSTLKTANLLVNRLDALRAAGLLQSC